jgi:hypothetical protein
VTVVMTAAHRRVTSEWQRARDTSGSPAADASQGYRSPGQQRRSLPVHDGVAGEAAHGAVQGCGGDFLGATSRTRATLRTGARVQHQADGAKGGLPRFGDRREQTLVGDALPGLAGPARAI